MPLVLLPHRLFHNIYVRELGRAYASMGCDVVYGPENFFETNLRPDLVHVQWPEELHRFSERGAHEVCERLGGLKQRGAKIAWTVHNARPHESLGGDADRAVYQAVIDSADIVHHHCSQSVDMISSAYHLPPNQMQYIAPHGHYLAYPSEMRQTEARSRLGISQQRFVFLHFGAIRGYKGLSQVLKGFGRVSRRNDLMVVAGRKELGLPISSRMMLAYHRYLPSRVCLFTRSIADDEIQMFFKAADVVVLGHTSGLNSGVAVLAMSFGRPVIGPDLGCIPSVLRHGQNLLYRPGSVVDLAARMVESRTLSLEDVAVRNQAAARTWDWKRIAEPALAVVTKQTSVVSVRGGSAC